MINKKWTIVFLLLLIVFFANSKVEASNNIEITKNETPNYSRVISFDVGAGIFAIAFNNYKVNIYDIAGNYLYTLNPHYSGGYAFDINNEHLYLIDIRNDELTEYSIEGEFLGKAKYGDLSDKYREWNSRNSVEVDNRTYSLIKNKYSEQILMTEDGSTKILYATSQTVKESRKIIQISIMTFLLIIFSTIIIGVVIKIRKYIRENKES